MREPSQAPRTRPATESALASKPFFQPMNAVTTTNPRAIRSTFVIDLGGYSLDWASLWGRSSVG